MVSSTSPSALLSAHRDEAMGTLDERRPLQISAEEATRQTIESLTEMIAALVKPHFVDFLQSSKAVFEKVIQGTLDIETTANNLVAYFRKEFRLMAVAIVQRADGIIIIVNIDEIGSNFTIRAKQVLGTLPSPKSE